MKMFLIKKQDIQRQREFKTSEEDLAVFSGILKLCTINKKADKSLRANNGRSTGPVEPDSKYLSTGSGVGWQKERKLKSCQRLA